MCDHGCFKRYFAVLYCFLLLLNSCYASEKNDFKNPPERSSKNGVLQATLRVACKASMIGEQSHSLRNYIDDTLPTEHCVGPVYRLKAGDLLKIHLINELPSSSEAPCGTSKPIENFTNLHTHGFHVSPAGNSDNVLLTIKPGQEFQYEIKIPEDHPPGTHWFHAHKHGSTAIQVSNGMSGGLIIEGEIDAWEPIAQLPEKIFILQQLGIVPEPSPKTTINGQLKPVIQMQPGQIERWRFIHSGISATVNLKVKGPDGSVIALHEFAKDGIATGKLEAHENIVMQPGFRSDVLFQPKEPGTYILLDDATSERESLLGEPESQEQIAIIEVEGDSVDMNLPRSEEFARFQAYKPVTDDELVEDVEKVWFERYSEGGKSRFTVNGKSFDDPDAETRTLVLDQAQKWNIWVGKKQIDANIPVNHPFHIHVNPFEVIERDSTGQITDRYWKDTVLISARDHREDTPLEIRTRYEEYIGEFVLHCHNLQHEDGGMMQLVKIITPGDSEGSHKHSSNK